MRSGGTIAAAIEGSLVDTARAYSRPDVPAGLAGTFGCKAAAVFFATLQNGMSLLARDGVGDDVPMAVAWSGGGPFEGMTRGHRRG